MSLDLVTLLTSPSPAFTSPCWGYRHAPYLNYFSIYCCDKTSRPRQLLVLFEAYSSRGLKSMFIVAGAWHLAGTEVAAERLSCSMSTRQRWVFKTSEPAPNGTPFPTRPRFLSFPNSSVNWGPNSKIYKLDSNR